MTLIFIQELTVSNFRSSKYNLTSHFVEISNETCGWYFKSGTEIDYVNIGISTNLICSFLF
jgi:hypothetical protein